MALDIIIRPTCSIDIVYCGNVRLLVGHLTQNERYNIIDSAAIGRSLTQTSFILPRTLAWSVDNVQFFIKVGPSYNELCLDQDYLIYIEVFCRCSGATPLGRCVDPIMQVHGTSLHVRSVNASSVLRSKLYMYHQRGWTQDWLDIYAVIVNSISSRRDRIRYTDLDGKALRAFFDRPPEGLSAPEHWKDYYYSEQRRQLARWKTLVRPAHCR